MLYWMASVQKLPSSRATPELLRPNRADNDMKSDGQSPKYSMEAAISGRGVYSPLVPEPVRTS